MFVGAWQFLPSFLYVCYYESFVGSPNLSLKSVQCEKEINAKVQLYNE